MSDTRKEFEKIQKGLGNETKLSRLGSGAYAEPATRIAWDWFKLGYELKMH